MRPRVIGHDERKSARPTTAASVKRLPASPIIILADNQSTSWRRRREMDRHRSGSVAIYGTPIVNGSGSTVTSEQPHGRGRSNAQHVARPKRRSSTVPSTASSGASRDWDYPGVWIVTGSLNRYWVIPTHRVPDGNRAGPGKHLSRMARIRQYESRVEELPHVRIQLTEKILFSLQQSVVSTQLVPMIAETFRSLGP